MNRTELDFSSVTRVTGRGMARLIAGIAVAAALGQAGIAQGQPFTYLDAQSGVGANTTLADGSAFTPPLNGTTGADNNWEERTTFASGGNVFEAGGENVTENAPEIRTTITGLEPGAKYTVYVNFWDPSSTGEDWNIRAGFASNPGSNTLFSAADATGDLGGATAAILASTLTYSTGPTIFLESSRNLLAGLIGEANANGSGEIAVYVDDLPTSLNVNRRTWYDGVSYAKVIDPLVGPTVITPPTVPVGGSAQMTATVSGTAPFFFQWLSNGVPVLNATNQTLSLANLQLANSGAGYSLVVSNNPAGSPAVVTNTPATLTVRTPLDLVWLSSASIDWNTNDINWDSNSDSVADIAFTDADRVRFDDSGSSFVTTTTNVYPSRVVVSNEFSAYTLTVFGSIGGNGPLIKQGASMLTLDLNNTYTGGTLIEGGGITLGTGLGTGSIGTGPVTNNAGLFVNRTGTLSIPGSISGTAGITINTAGGNTVGNVILSGTNSYNGATEINGGTLTLANSSALGSSPGVTATSTTGGPGGGTRVELSGGVTIAGKTYTMNTSLSPDNRCVLSGVGSAGVTNTWTGPIVINGDGLAQILNQGGTTLVVSGNLSGTPNNLLLRGSGSSTGLVSGTLTLGASSIVQIADGSTWTITSTGNSWGTNRLSNESKLVLGAHNALPTGSALVAEGVGNPRNQLLDLNGFNQTLAELNVNAITITNRSASADSTLTYNSAGTSVFTGVIGDGTRKMNLSLAAGTLVLSNATALNIPNSSVSVAAGAVLQMDFTGTNTVTALITNGVSVVPGVYNSANASPFLGGTGNLLVPSPIATNPTNITFSVSVDSLNLSWPSGHLGWILQSQTNSASVGLSTNWVDVTGSGAVTMTNFTISPADPTIFFRLRSP